MDRVVELEIPARPEFVGVARMAVGALAGIRPGPLEMIGQNRAGSDDVDPHTAVCIVERGRFGERDEVPRCAALTGCGRRTRRRGNG